MRKSIVKVAVFASVLGLAPAAQAFTGMLVSCNPTDGVAIPIALSPGLDCNDTVNKISVAASMDGCVGNGAAPWSTWSAAKFPGKMSAAGAAALTAVDIKLKAKTFGSCNFSGSPTSAGASGSGKYTFRDGAGNKYGKGAVFGTVGGDLATQSAKLVGLVTKGDSTGAHMTILIGLDLSNPGNANVLGCNLGAVCPPPIPPSTTLFGITSSSSMLWMGYPQDSDCTAVSLPWDCCTGAGTGNC